MKCTLVVDVERTWTTLLIEVNVHVSSESLLHGSDPVDHPKDIRDLVRILQIALLLPFILGEQVFILPKQILVLQLKNTKVYQSEDVKVEVPIHLH